MLIRRVGLQEFVDFIEEKEVVQEIDLGTCRIAVIRDGTGETPIIVVNTDGEHHAIMTEL